MAEQLYLKKLQDESEYQEMIYGEGYYVPYEDTFVDYVSGSTFDLPNVIYIEDDETVKYFQELKDKAGDICVSKDGKFYYVTQEYFNSHKSAIESTYEIEGVIVVPSAHADNGRARIISLKNMDTSNPENGGDNTKKVVWGYNDFVIPDLDLYTDIVICEYDDNPRKLTFKNESLVNNEIDFGEKMPALPIKNTEESYGLDHFENPFDNGTIYTENGGEKYFVPSPYLPNSGKNPAYRTEQNALCDFDGYKNTLSILLYATGQTDWKTDSTVTNSYNVGFYPAACCCYRYGTNALPSGKWYLPAIGELGYLNARFDDVQSGITSCTNGISLNDFYISSTQVSSQNVWSAANSSGEIGDYSKNSLFYCRAFAQVELLPFDI